MSTITWIVIIGLGIAIAVNNKEKIIPLIENILKKPTEFNQFETIEVNPEAVRKAKAEALEHFFKEKQKRKNRIEELTRDLKKEINQIDIKIAMIKETNKQEYRL